LLAQFSLTSCHVSSGTTCQQKNANKTNQTEIWICVYLDIILSLCFQVMNAYVSNTKQKHTSSTAQGGGSFKHRKPIGEIGCCESGMDD
jgi:hypothetical protein